MSSCFRAIRAAIGAAAILGTPLAAQDSTKAAGPAKPTKLFSSDSVFTITIASDMKRFAETRDSLAPYMPAKLIVGGDTLRVGIRQRGHFRRKASSCTFPPVSVKFEKDVKGTVFAKQKKLRLVTTCRPGTADYEGYIPQEYMLYRVYGLLTPLSFRARLVRVTYADTTGKGRDAISTMAFFVEDQKDMAARNAGAPIEGKNAVRDDFDAPSLALLSLFEYFIGNTDLSFAAQHNIRFVRTSEFGSGIFPVAYDFDWSGAVNTRYAVPDRSLPIRSVRERIWMSYCFTAADLAPAIATFNDRRAAIAALYTETSILSKEAAQQTLDYFDAFYKVVNDPARLAKEIKRHCAG